jgi:hypothetical protein
MGWVATDISDENAANRLALLCIDLPEIRARANALTNSSYNSSTDPEAKAILSFAQMVDGNLQQWYQTLPPEWQYRTVDMVYEMPGLGEDGEEDVSQAPSWLGPQHAYHDVNIASIVNDYRVCRIFCQRVIMACVGWLSQGSSVQQITHAQEYQHAMYVIQQMVDEISACVTFHMNYDWQPVARELGQERNGESETLPYLPYPIPLYPTLSHSTLPTLTNPNQPPTLFIHTTHLLTIPHPAAEAFGGYSLVWPLYVASNAETVPQRQRDWLSGRLFVIGMKFGLSNAQVLVLARRHVLTCSPMFP